MLVESILGLLLLASIVGNVLLFRANTKRNIALSEVVIQNQMTTTWMKAEEDRHKQESRQHQAQLADLKKERHELRGENADINTKYDYLCGEHEAKKASWAVQIAGYKENEEGAMGRAQDLMVENAELKGMRRADLNMHQTELNVLNENLAIWHERDEILRKMYIELVDKVMMGKADTIRHAPLSPLSAVPPPLGSPKRL